MTPLAKVITVVLTAIALPFVTVTGLIGMAVVLEVAERWILLQERE